VGDLVRWNLSPCDLEIFNAVGMIIEMRQLQWESLKCRVLWADEGVAQWYDVRDVAPMQTETECGIT
jgi:hypothetical protein